MSQVTQIIAKLVLLFVPLKRSPIALDVNFLSITYYMTTQKCTTRENVVDIKG
jgi:hypothetical protein